MSKDNKESVNFRYPNSLGRKEDEVNEQRDVELHYMGNKINPYSLKDLDIDEVSRVIAVDSYEDIADEVREIARKENVLAIFEDNTESLEDAVNKITEPKRDEITYIITDEPEGEYISETYRDGNLVEKSVINDYEKVRDLTQAKVLGTSLDTLNVLQKAKSELEEFEEQYQNYISGDESLTVLPDKETKELKDSLEEFEESLHEAKQILEPEASPKLHDELRALDAKQEMIMFEIEEPLDNSSGIPSSENQI